MLTPRGETASLLQQSRDATPLCPPGPKSPALASFEPNFEFKNWSGARDLNPGPHGPEPCACRVLACPEVSSSVLWYSISLGVVSAGVLPCPPVSANA